MAKIELSETIHFQPSIDISFDPASTSKSTLKINVDPVSITPASTISGQVHCLFADDATSAPTSLDYLAVSLEGQIMVNGNSTPFVHAAEIEHGRTIQNQTHFVLPFAIRIPTDALPSNPEVIWKLSARAVWKNKHIIQEQITLTVMPSSII